ncbi:MAG: hypothetical protein V8R75_02700 [Oscillospiraceae bacterium]
MKRAGCYPLHDGQRSIPVEMTRSSNTFDVDGMSVTLKGTFGYEGDKLGRIPGGRGRS